MKTKKELYQLCLDCFNDPNFHSSYICNVFNLLSYKHLITMEELNFILDDLKLNKPNKEQHSEFMVDSWDGNFAWWSLDWDIRIKFLTKMVEIN